MKTSATLKGKHLGTLIKIYREKHPRKYSQTDLAFLLGYKNGQFISNVERFLCNLPVKKMPALSRILNLDIESLKEAHRRDMIEEFHTELDMALLDENDVQEEAYAHQ